MAAKRKSSGDLKRELEKIYTDGEGHLPDFTRLDGKQGNRLRSVLFGLLIFFAVLAAVSWAGFFIFIRPSAFTGEGVSLRVETPERLTVGAEADVVLHYSNKERVPLASASLSAELPDGFIMTSSDPAIGQDGRWTVGSVAVGADGDVRIHGWVRKEVGKTMTFRASLNYKPADFNSPFQKVASHTVAIGDSALTLSATGTDTMTPGDKGEFRFAYENGSDRDLENLRFALDPLDGFVFDSSKPLPDKDANDGSWTIPKIAARAKGEIVIRGTFSSASRGSKQLHGRIGFVTGDGAFIVAADAAAATEVQKSDLAVNLIVNGSNQAPAVSFGDTLQFSLVYKNAGDVHLKDVTLTANLPSQPEGIDVVDWVSLKDDLKGDRGGPAVTWSKKQLPDLQDLKPGAEGTINFSVQLINKPSAQSKDSRYAVTAQVLAKVAKVGRTATSREVVSDPLAIVLNSDAVFKAFGRYFDETGVPLGSGPLPPKVGQTTVYRINWVVQNTLHELTNLSISTVLPQNVKWTGTVRPVDAGELSFDGSGRKATWRLNRMPTSVKSLAITFDVQYTPSLEEVGTIPPLTGDARFEAFDKETQTVILKTEHPVAADLLGDSQAAGKGVVTE